MRSIVADHRDVEVWKRSRSGRIGASDACRYARIESVEKYVAAKLMPPWEGSEFSSWGHQREAQILADHGYEQNHYMFASAENPRHVATPDGIGVKRLAQVKTTIHDFRSKRDPNKIVVPAHYRRQCWWEQYVMGYEETDFIYEVYSKVNGQIVPEFDSTSVLITRDDAEIAKMIQIADMVLARLDLAEF